MVMDIGLNEIDPISISWLKKGSVPFKVAVFACKGYPVVRGLRSNGGAWDGEPEPYGGRGGAGERPHLLIIAVVYLF